MRELKEPAGPSKQAISDGKTRQGAHVSEMQRRRLLSAIVEVLGEYGYEGATVGRVCKCAGVSRRTFYDIYDDREACFLDAFEVAIERLTNQIAPIYTTPDGGRQAGRRWRERVRGALIVLLEYFDAEPGLARLCLVETLKAGPKGLERRRAVTDTLTLAIDEGRLEAKSADPPPLTAESLVGGTVSIIHARLVAAPPPAVGGDRTGGRDTRSRGERDTITSMVPRIVELINPLMSMIVLPYLGPAAARKELDRPTPVPRVASKGSNGHAPAPASDPFRGLPIRITFRTVRVLATIAAQPDASNREIGQDAGVADQGQMSKLLHRLEKAGLIKNHGEGQTRGEPNAWQLTTQGHRILHAISDDDG